MALFCKCSFFNAIEYSRRKAFEEKVASLSSGLSEMLANSHDLKARSGKSWERMSMKYNIPDRVMNDIEKIAKKNGIEKVILFGSRARGTHNERSDIDLAASGGNVSNFFLELNDDAWTLLTFDVINLDKSIPKVLENEIQRDGVIVYEKGR